MIFGKVKGLRGYLDVVRVAREEKRRYGKHGELLVDFEGEIAQGGEVKGDEAETSHRETMGVGMESGESESVGEKR